VIWKVLQAIVLFATAGLVLAARFSDSLGLGGVPYLIVATGLGITMLLMYRSPLSLVVIAILTILVSLPEATLQHNGLDRDMLLAFAIAVLSLPVIRRFTS
jgi:hypothetical protein